MIPKIIHYCWFGKGLMPKSQKDCIKRWKKLMPDYQFMRWDESTFDVQKYEASRNAYEVKKYSMVSNVCRYNVLAQYGGIYLDTDVDVFKSYDDLLQYDFFSAIEYYPNEFKNEHIAEQFLNEDGSTKDASKDIPHLEILTSTIGCVPNQKMITDIRDYYNNLHLDVEKMRNYPLYVKNDRLVARYLTHYGFRYKDETQYIKDNMVVFGTGVFGYAFSPKATCVYSYHHNAASWSDSQSKHHMQELKWDKVGLLWLLKFLKKIKHAI